MFRAIVGLDLYLPGPTSTKLDHDREEEAREYRVLLGSRIRNPQTRRKDLPSTTFEEVFQLMVDSVSIRIQLLCLIKQASDVDRMRLMVVQMSPYDVRVFMRSDKAELH